MGFHLGVSITEASLQDGRVSLQLRDSAGTTNTLSADHVIAATGYKPDLQRLTFLDSGILGEIRCVGQTPVLSSNFESTVRNLYFVGVAAANTFGPSSLCLRSQVAAPRISKHLARRASRDPVGRDSAPTCSPRPRSAKRSKRLRDKRTGLSFCAPPLRKRSSAWRFQCSNWIP